MKRRIATLMALAFSGSALLPAIPAYAAEDRLTDHGKTDYVVVAENPAVSMELEAAYEGSRISSDAGSVQQEGILALTLSDEEKSILENREDVHVEEDIILHACTALEPTDRVEETGDQGIEPEKQWNLDMIAASAQEITPGGNAADIKVAVIDSGVGFTTDIDVERSVNLIPGEEEVGTGRDYGSRRRYSVYRLFRPGHSVRRNKSCGIPCNRRGVSSLEHESG